LPRATNARYRAVSRLCAFHAISRILGDTRSSFGSFFAPTGARGPGPATSRHGAERFGPAGRDYRSTTRSARNAIGTARRARNSL
jgi:hypothetical protein